jgi:N-acetylglucosaminyldiphosphoundecaprenol N-acetyl-beta-D-mannosaminyltransferase
MQFTPDGSEADTAIDLIQQAQPNIVFICLGMPKQEYFAFRYRREQTT